MKVGNSVRVKECACLQCGYELDAVTCIGKTGNVKPKSGDITICIKCAYVMAYDDDHNFRKLTSEEKEIVLQEPRIIAAQKALRQVKK